MCIEGHEEDKTLQKPISRFPQWALYPIHLVINHFAFQTRTFPLKRKHLQFYWKWFYLRNEDIKVGIAKLDKEILRYPEKKRERARREKKKRKKEGRKLFYTQRCKLLFRKQLFRHQSLGQLLITYHLIIFDRCYSAFIERQQIFIQHWMNRIATTFKCRWKVTLL